MQSLDRKEAMKDILNFINGEYVQNVSGDHQQPPLVR
jgi:hypothetical protein